MGIQRKAFEESNNVNPDWSFKFDEELQQYVAVDFEMTNQVDEFNEHWDTFRAGWDAKAQAVPEPSIDLTGHDIKYIINFMCYEDPDNLDTEVTIQKCKSGFDGAGLYAWVSEYPEEGGIKLGEAQEQSHD